MLGDNYKRAKYFVVELPSWSIGSQILAIKLYGIAYKEFDRLAIAIRGSVYSALLNSQEVSSLF